MRDRRKLILALVAVVGVIAVIVIDRLGKEPSATEQLRIRVVGRFLDGETRKPVAAELVVLPTRELHADETRTAELRKLGAAGSTDATGAFELTVTAPWNHRTGAPPRCLGVESLFVRSTSHGTSFVDCTALGDWTVHVDGEDYATLDLGEILLGRAP